ncbi:4-hydroxythreonine-4-phosphate dehydrogenase PdxA [Paenalcaligenes sp. Me52]|uniref:4-hydroxythreonine-4-phosphate dehydrogenase PdxA n=1 Tax=Paenalcaligenes sp. Me52 TaxID=3392038 RepID=UPI003D2AA24B
MNSNSKPVIALTLGDPAGIGSELIAKLLSQTNYQEHAKVVLVGDKWLWEFGQKVANVQVPTQPISSFAELAQLDGSIAYYLETNTIEQEQVQLGVVGAAAGASTLAVLTLCMDAVQDGYVDAICFAPLNKAAMKQSGMQFEDELHFFADYLNVESYFCEFNTLDGLWTSRVSSHVPLKEAVSWITKDRIIEASKLLYDSLRASGNAQPRVAVAALNPHGGEGGLCGTEELDIIAPALQALNQSGYAVQGPFPADTIFLKARDKEIDGIVTLYHDQGQIAIKLMGFEKGVTVQGGLPIPITTPAHGTAFDIAGKNKANLGAMQNAFLIACRMGKTFKKA